MAGKYGLGAKVVITSFTTIWSTALGGYESTSSTLLELTNIGDINMTAEDIDVSSHASRIKQYIKGQVELGEVPFEGNYQSSDGPVVLEYLQNGGSTGEQEIIVPGTLMMRFPGYVKGFGFGIPHDGKVSMSGALKIAGTPTLYDSTST